MVEGANALGTVDAMVAQEARPIGAQLAAALGLPYAFASHFAPAHLDEALAIYRHRFKPSARTPKPHVMAAVGVIAAANKLGLKSEHAIAQYWFGIFAHSPAGVPFVPEGPTPHLIATLNTFEQLKAAGLVARIHTALETF